MKILKLILSNFKHFEDQTIEFNDDINVLIGENNAGKTSIIQAIAAVFEIPFGGNIENEFPTKLIDPPFTTRVEIEVAFTKDELIILRGIKNIDVAQNRRFNDQEWDKIISFIIENNLSFRLRLNIEVVNKNTTQLRRGGLKREDLEIYSRVDEIREIIKEFNEDLDHNYVMNKISVNLNQILLNSINNPQNLPFKPLVLFPFLSEFRSSENFISYINLQQNLKGSYRHHNVRAQLFHLKMKNPKAFTEFKKRMEANFRGIKDVSIEFDFDTGYFNLILDSFGRDITLYGGGTQTFAQIFSIIGFEDYSIILIDEPDAHLHASLAENFVEYLKELSISKQIVFTTHLPNIINIIPTENIISLKLETGKSIHDKLAIETDIYSELSKMGILPSTYDRELLKRADIVIFTEGKTDKPILMGFLKKYQKLATSDLIYPKIEFLPIGKIYSSDLNKMKTGIMSFLKDKRFLYIRDRDEDSPEEIQRIVEFDGFPVHVWKFRQIESYLLDISALTDLIISKRKSLGLEETRDQIKQIISDEERKQFGILIHDYIDNRMREELTTPERKIDINPSSNIDEITSKIHDALIAKKAITHIGSMEKNKIYEGVNDYLINWREYSIFMINAKEVLSEIRKNFDLNFQNSDIISYLENIPEEIEGIIKNHIIKE